MKMFIFFLLLINISATRISTRLPPNFLDYIQNGDGQTVFPKSDEMNMMRSAVEKFCDIIISFALLLAPSDN